MKKFLSSLLVLVALGLQLVQATDASTNLISASNYSLQAVPLKLTSLEVVNNHPTATVTVLFYDSPSTNTTWVSGAYTNTTTYTTNIVVITTDYYSNTTTNTNAAVYTIAHAVSAATNSYRLIKSMTATAGATVSWVPSGGVYTSYGLGAQNSATNTTINYVYSTIR